MSPPKPMNSWVFATWALVIFIDVSMLLTTGYGGVSLLVGFLIASQRELL